MWKSSDSKTSQPVNASKPQPANPSFAELQPTAPARVAPNAVPHEHSMIGKSMVIKGEIASSEPLYIDGRVEGSISAPAHRVTIGREGKVKAGITAREVVIMGDLCGNLNVGDRVDIRSDGSLAGDVVAHRISIEDGAFFKGAMDARKPVEKNKEAEAKKEPRLALEPAEVPAPAKPEADLDRWAQTSFSVSDRS